MRRRWRFFDENSLMSLVGPVTWSSKKHVKNEDSHNIAILILNGMVLYDTGNALFSTTFGMCSFRVVLITPTLGT